MLSDALSNKKVVKVLDPAAAYTADQNASADGIDLAGFLESLFLFTLGASGDTLDTTTTYINLKLQHSDEADANFEDVPVKDLLVKGDNTIANPAVAGVAYKITDEGTNDSKVYPVSYIGSKRYVRPVIDFVGTHNNGTFASICAVLGRPLAAPVLEDELNPAHP